MDHRLGPIVVIGATWAGLAAAARLSAVGHDVIVVDRRRHLVGSPDFPEEQNPLRVDPVLTLPAVWRDLFRKTGQTFDRELSALGYTLTAAAPVEHVLSPSASIVMPASRADQFEAISDSFGRDAASQWRDFVDRLDDTWQIWRGCGLEAELPSRTVVRRHRDGLMWGRSVQDLAGDAPAVLQPLVTSTAWLAGSAPSMAPAFVAAQLAVERAFGRWCITDTRGFSADSDTLVKMLVRRMQHLAVDVRLGVEVVGMDAAQIVTTTAGTIAASAIINTTHPWHPVAVGGIRTHRWRRVRPARRPASQYRHTSANGTSVTQQVHHGPDGPVVSFSQHHGEGSFESVFDYPHAATDPSFGAAWKGIGSWWSRPALRQPDGWYSATKASAGGNSVWAQLLTGALAAYAAHETLTGQNIRPTNRDYRPRVARRRSGPTPHRTPQ